MRATSFTAAAFVLATYAPVPLHAQDIQTHVRTDRCLGSPLIGPITVNAGFHDPNHPLLRVYGPHDGVDFHADVGSPVLAAATGIVVNAGPNRYGTNIVDISLPGIRKLRYAHLSRIYVERGQYVRRGEVIGRSGGAIGAKGSGPATTGPHLHLELFMNDSDRSQVDIIPFLCQPPVKK